MPRFLMSFRSDIQLGVRRLVANPGFALVAILTLALSVGMSTTAYSVLNSILFDSTSIIDENRIVNVHATARGLDNLRHFQREFQEYEERNSVFNSMFAFTNRLVNFEQLDGTVASLIGIQVTGGAFETLAASPVLGRAILEEDTLRGAPAVGVLSYRIWREQFARDPTVIGRLVELNGVTTEIVGVLPEGLFPQLDLWESLSLESAAAQRNAGNANLAIVARLRDGVSVQEAEVVMDTLAPQVRGALFGVEATNGIRLETLREANSGRAQAALFVLVVSGLVLLIACINLASLQLARMSASMREFGTRSALGATRYRLIRQSLAETMILSIVGGSGAFLVALIGISVINETVYSTIVDQLVVTDFRVLEFALLVTLLAGLIFGSVPAWLASRPKVTILRSSARLSGHGRAHSVMHRSLIVGQLALALVVLVASAILTQTLIRAVTFEPGWNVDGLLTAALVLDSPRYESAEARHAFFEDLEQTLINSPRIENASLALSLPVNPYTTSGMGLLAEGQPSANSPDNAISADFGGVTANYFDALGMRLLEGRGFRATDDHQAPLVMIINQAVADRLWPGESAIGKRISAGSAPDNPMWREVIGVVNDIGYPARPLSSGSRYQVYGPLYQYSEFAVDGVAVAVRTSTNPEVAAALFHRVLSEVDPALAARNVRPATDIIDDALSEYFSMTTILGSFAIVGLAIAIVGIYGVTSYTVAQRRRELGIRIALGAQRTDIKALILRQGITLIVLAIAIGLAGTTAVERVLIATLPETQTSLGVVLAVIGLLTSIALIATYLPARRAASVSPVKSLRAE